MLETDGSLAGWLGLRESSDVACRSRKLTAAVVSRLPAGRPIRAVDLGTGTGSNIRFLSPWLGSAVRWTAVDRDPVLLARVPPDATRLQQELGALEPEIFGRCDLVTASALLDLVSEAWIVRLAGICRSVGAAVLFALNYDGRFRCWPREPEDRMVRELFNRHQRTNDKGFGAAAGPDAAAIAVRVFRDAGYRMHQERTDWRITPDHEELQRLLIRGWADAAGSIAPECASGIEDWLTRRLAHVDAGRSRIGVGHVDLGGWPVR